MFLTMFCRKKRSLIGMKSLPRNDRQPPEYGSESGPISNDELIYFTPNEQRIIRAGECAQAEQRRLEKQLGLLDGRTPRPG
jgi:hypothetical protein